MISTYQKFLETGSVGDRAHTRKSPTSKSLVNTFVEDETVNHQNYLQMLQAYFYTIMQRKRLQQDGVPPAFPKKFIYN